MSSLILVVAMFFHGVSGNNEMFPSEASFEGAVHAPPAEGCSSIVRLVDMYYIFGKECTRIPEHPDESGSSLSILATGIEVIRKGDLDSWSELLSLTLNMNSDLKEIEEGAFTSLSLLTNLSISNNYNLNILSPDVFAGLHNLKELRFIKNNVKSLFPLILAARPFMLPSLTHLDLSDNPIQKLTREDFVEMEGSVLEKLNLRLCGLYSIEPNTFSWFEELKDLNLDNNKLSTETISKLIINLNETAPSLRHLGIGSNFLNKNPYKFLSLVAKTRISSLDLKENHFEFVIPSLLKESPFPFMPYIEELDLSGVLGYELQPWTFSPALPNLRKLIFAKNQLPGFLPGLHLSSLVELDLSENVCENCPVKPSFNIEEYSLTDMVSLQVLTLSDNYIYRVTTHMFAGLYSLRTLYLSNCSIFAIEEYSFEYLISLRKLDLSRNKLSKKEALPAAVFFGLGNLTSLRLDDCDISSFSRPEIFQYLPKLEHLTLNDNKLVQMDPKLFAWLPNLEILDISSNAILPWNERVFSNNKKLQLLILNSNHIYKLTNYMLEDVAEIDVLRLRNNPFSCHCGLVRIFIDSGVDYSRENFGISDRSVKCYLPKEWADTRVTEFIRAKSSRYECLPWAFIGSLVGIIFLFTVAVGSVASYFFRWYIRYWIFLFRQKWRSSFPGRRRHPIQGKYQYDAFVSYCNEDRNFVIRLVAMLENYDPHYRLCVFERDFNAGDVISQSVVDCLSSSRKSILVLTDAFARSHWCQWELQMAHHKRIFFKQEGHEDSLILVKLGDVMEAHMTPTLRYLMKSRVYLQWHSDPKRQRIFWEKLRDALRPSGVDVI